MGMWILPALRSWRQIKGDAVRFKVKALLPISPQLLVLALLTFAGLQMFQLAVAWLGMQIGRDEPRSNQQG